MASPLGALSPLDGRYEKSADPLRPYFSEAALIRHRVLVEIEWLKALAAERRIRELKPFSRATTAALDRLMAGFAEKDATHIKNIEAETNHDVKAIEYWLKGKLAKNAQVQRSLDPCGIVGLHDAIARGFQEWQQPLDRRGLGRCVGGVNARKRGVNIEVEERLGRCDNTGPSIRVPPDQLIGVFALWQPHDRNLGLEAALIAHDRFAKRATRRVYRG